MACLVAVAGFWFVALKPKRAEADAASRAGRRGADPARHAPTRPSRRPRAPARASTTDYATVARLGKAVPEDDDAASLVFQLETAARKAGIDFRSLTVGGAAPAAPRRPDAGAARRHVQVLVGQVVVGHVDDPVDDRDAGAPGTTGTTGLPPGVVAGTDGMNDLPFTFVFDGDYFALTKLLDLMRSFTTAKGDTVTVRGRLMTVEGVEPPGGPRGLPEGQGDRHRHGLPRRPSRSRCPAAAAGARAARRHDALHHHRAVQPGGRRHDSPCPPPPDRSRPMSFLRNLVVRPRREAALARCGPARGRARRRPVPARRGRRRPPPTRSSAPRPRPPPRRRRPRPTDPRLGGHRRSRRSRRPARSTTRSGSPRRAGRDDRRQRGADAVGVRGDADQRRHRLHGRLDDPGRRPTPSPTTATPSDSTTTPEDRRDTRRRSASTCSFGEPGSSKQKAHATSRASAPCRRRTTRSSSSSASRTTRRPPRSSSRATRRRRATAPASRRRPTARRSRCRRATPTFLDIDLGAGVRQFRLDVDRVGEVDKDDVGEGGRGPRPRVRRRPRAPALRDRVRRGSLPAWTSREETGTLTVDADGERRPARSAAAPTTSTSRSARMRAQRRSAASQLLPQRSSGEAPVPRRPRGRPQRLLPEPRHEPVDGRDAASRRPERLRADHAARAAAPPRRRRAASRSRGCRCAASASDDARRGGRASARTRPARAVVAAEDLDLTDLALEPADRHAASPHPCRRPPSGPPALRSYAGRGVVRPPPHHRRRVPRPRPDLHRRGPARRPGARARGCSTATWPAASSATAAAAG